MSAREIEICEIHNLYTQQWTQCFLNHEEASRRAIEEAESRLHEDGEGVDWYED